MRKVDITEKLNFEENPRIVIKGTEYEVNADAPTVLKIMGTLGEGENVSPKDIVNMYEMMFPKKERDKIEKLKLQFNDFETVVYSAITLITGENDTQGE